MREVTRDEKFPNDPTTYADDGVDVGDQLQPVLVSGPSETELVTIALLMRLYDVGIEILRAHNEERADELWDLHDKGGHANPKMFIPDVNSQTVEDEPEV